MRFDTRRSYATTLVFAAGPNANTGSLAREESSSMRRTYSAAAAAAYPLLEEGVRCALRAALDASIAEGCDVCLVAGLSTGIYAGPWRERINAEFARIVEGLLAEPLATGGEELPRGCYFRRVVWAKL